MDLTDLYHVRRALDSYEHRVGRDQLPEGFLTVLDALRLLDEDIARHLPTFADTQAAAVAEIPDDGTVSYRTAAETLGVAPRTVGRYVKAGKLIRVGRRVTSASIRNLLEGER